MATTSKSGNVVGLEHAQVWLAGPGSFSYGVTGAVASNGSTMHAKLLAFPRSAALPAITRTVVALTGGNRWLGQVMFGINEIGSFPLILSNLDGDFHALATNSAADGTTNQRWRRFSANENLGAPPQLGLMLTTIFQSREDGSDGENLYIHYIIPRCQVSPTFPQMSYQAAGDVTYTVSPTMSEFEPHGLAFEDGAMSLKQNRALMYALVTPKPLALTTFLGDATADEITLGFLPTSNVVTVNNTPNEVVIAGTPTAATSVSTSTGVVVLSAAPAAAAKVGILYETDFEPIPA